MHHRRSLTTLFRTGLFVLATGPLSGESIWTISNIAGSNADFASVEEALASENVVDGDTLEIHPSAESYGAVTLDKAVHLQGLPDTGGGTLEPELRTLSLPEGLTSETTNVQVRGIGMGNLSVQSDNLLVESCRIGAIEGLGAGQLQVLRSWINLYSGDRIELESCSDVVFQGNLILVNGEATGFYSDQESQTTFRYNTVVDPSGSSEWVIYQGEFKENIVMVPEGRLAFFDLEPTGNLSTRRSFANVENTDNVPGEDLFVGGSETIEQYLPLSDGPASGTGTGGSDLGFTGGATPIDLALIPGSGQIADIPPEPFIQNIEALVDGLAVQWTISQLVDGFELQVSVDGGSFAKASLYSHETTETSLTDLGEGISARIRIRSVRDGVSSAWVLSDTITTLYTPPPEPVLDGLNAMIDGLDVTWTSSEGVDQFELQYSIDGTGFGESRFYPGTSTSASLDGLGEGVGVVIRLRTLRNGLSSSWITSNTVTTLFSPPPEPVLAGIQPLPGGLDITWSSPQEIDQYEVQVSIDGAGFGDSRYYPGTSAGASLEDLGEGVSVVLRLRSVRNDIVSSWITSDPVDTLTAYNPEVHYAELLGGEITPYDTWLQSSWLGWFSDLKGNFVLHLEHGYLYLLGIPGSTYVYDYATGLWFWTSESYYPNLYLFQDPPQWYLYYKGTATPNRYFYNHHTGENFREDAL